MSSHQKEEAHEHTVSLQRYVRTGYSHNRFTPIQVIELGATRDTSNRRASTKRITSARSEHRSGNKQEPQQGSSAQEVAEGRCCISERSNQAKTTSNYSNGLQQELKEGAVARESTRAGVSTNSNATTNCTKSTNGGGRYEWNWIDQLTDRN